ncbi:MAG: hypothetical protein M1544_03495 [Candidatus Marsarchaeota archaeon]|nr:hypothetical protein [Candidatus Marsarchaeota archaeon]MCL5102393.1 hypothetical protein [Candidatus Marsarchaeota archaeon]
MPDLFKEMENIDSELKRLEAEMERAEKLARELVRACGIAITKMHRGSPDSEQELEKAKASAMELAALENTNENMVNGALQEYAEAYIFYSVITKKSVPDREETGVNSKAYLSGLMDAVGELKREVFEALSKNDLENAKFYTSTMQDIYDSCRGIRYQEHVLPGFRRKQDVARVLVEGCRAEILRFER